MFRTLGVLVAASALVVVATACSGEAAVDLDAQVGGAGADGEVTAGGDAACQDAVDDLAAASEGVAEALRGPVEDFGDVVAGLEGLVDAAPEQIRADVRLLFDAYSTYLELWLESGIDSLFGDGEESEDAAALRDAGEALRTPELDAARERVGDWLREHCAEGA